MQKMIDLFIDVLMDFAIHAGVILDAFWFKESIQFLDRFWHAFWRLAPRSGEVPRV